MKLLHHVPYHTGAESWLYEADGKEFTVVKYYDGDVYVYHGEELGRRVSGAIAAQIYILGHGIS